MNKLTYNFSNAWRTYDNKGNLLLGHVTLMLELGAFWGRGISTPGKDVRSEIVLHLRPENLVNEEAFIQCLRNLKKNSGNEIALEEDFCGWQVFSQVKKLLNYKVDFKLNGFSVVHDGKTGTWSSVSILVDVVISGNSQVPIRLDFINTAIEKSDLSRGGVPFPESAEAFQDLLKEYCDDYGVSSEYLSFPNIEMFTEEVNAKLNKVMPEGQDHHVWQEEPGTSAPMFY